MSDMETKYVRVSFEVELAKKITEKSVDGRIVTRDGRSVRVICFDAHCEDNIVALVGDSLGIESTFNYLNDGKFYIGDEKECDLFIEIPEYMTFKDGDILYCKGVYNWIFIYRSNGGDKTSCYAAVMDKSSVLFLGLCIMSDEEVKDLRFATEEEKKRIIDILKASKEPKEKECLKILGIEVKQEYEFKPFDKVLVRDDDENSTWSCNLFSGENEDGTYMCIGGYWDMCIPYNEQTAHLLGTTENYE